MKKIITLVLSVCMILAALTVGLSAAPVSARDTANLLMGPEPDTIDPALILSSDSATYAFHVFEGLMRIGDGNKLVPGAAEKYEISKDGTVYTFHIRQSAKWSDGVAVKAQDFEYAWKRALDPKAASGYAYILYPVKNAEEANTGKVSLDEVGVKAKDDDTLVVTLKAPTPYFLTICNYQTTMPVRKDIIEKYGDKWTQDPASYIGNGAYKVTTWKHKEVLSMTKNPNYWDVKNIPIKNINWKLIEDDKAGLAAYESGDLDAVLNRHVPAAEVANFIKKGKVKVYPGLGTDYSQFGLLKPSTKAVLDKRVRQALALAIDRTEYVKVVGQAGQKPATAYVPYGIPEGNSDFRKVGGDFLPAKADVKKAKKLLAQAGYPNGKGFPTIEYVYNTATRNQRAAEFLQQQWKKNLNINVKITNMEWKVLIPKRTAHDFTLARGGWSGDYIDPMTFLDMFTKNSGNNDPAFNNPKYDELIAKAQVETDQTRRFKYMHDAEKILMDEMPIIPIMFNVEFTMESPKLKGVYTSPLGIVYTHHAYFTKK